MSFSFLSRIRWFKVLMIVAGVCMTLIVSIILFSIFVVWGLGYAKGVAEIENMLIGSWVIKTDTLETPQIIEVFNADGTWVLDHADDTLCKGKWHYVDNMKININETEVIVGKVSEHVNRERLIAIVDLGYDSIVCKEGDRQFVLKRIRNPVFPKDQ